MSSSTIFTAVLFPVNGPAVQVTHNQKPKKAGKRDSDALSAFMRKQVGAWDFVEPCLEFQGNGKLLVLWQSDQAIPMWGDDEGVLEEIPFNKTFPQFRGPLLLTAMNDEGECESCTLGDWKKSK